MSYLGGGISLWTTALSVAAGIRIGCVHGTTFDIAGFETNFPIRQDAGQQRGLDYLAIGDTHSFRDVNEKLPWPAVPTVYPGAPEPTAFDEKNAGNVAIVGMYARITA